jgi:hypothetical protein
MTIEVTVHGDDELVRTLHQAAADLSDMSAADKRAGDAVLAATRPRTPVRTGRLVSSLAATVTTAGVTVFAGAPYAGYVHAANPFLIEAAKAVEPTVVGFYAGVVQATVDEVHGA